jgi:sugar phosphate isomerase/epimerase
MKLGVLTGLWFVAEKLPLLKSLERINKLGCRYVDIHGTFHAGPSDLSPHERLAVKEAMEKLNLQPRSYVLHAPRNIASATDAELESCYDYLAEGIGMAQQWGMHHLMLNAGQWAYGVTRSLAWERSVHFLQQVCDLAALQDMYICQETEPHVWYLVNNTSTTLQMLADVDRPNFATLVDLGHMALAREGPEELVALRDWIIHVHLTDHEPFQHTNQVVGTGLTPIADYLEALTAMGIDRCVKRFGYEELVISLELGCPGDRIGNADEKVRSSLENLRRIAPYLSLT